jgi:hypothetical protein
MGRDTNVEIFRDTVDLVKTNPALRAEVAASTKKQEIILETDKVEVPSLSKYTENVRVIVPKKRSFEAAGAYRGKKLLFLILHLLRIRVEV